VPADIRRQKSPPIQIVRDKLNEGIGISSLSNQIAILRSALSTPLGVAVAHVELERASPAFGRE
jgi:hypothetical protein